MACNPSKSIVPIFIGLSILLCLLAWGCTKKEYRDPEKGTLRVKNYAYEQYSWNHDVLNIKVTLKGTNPEKSQISDTAGVCIFKDVPMGTYTIVASKEGYGTYEIQNFQFLGGAEVSTAYTILGEKSTIKIKNYTLSLASGPEYNTLHISGTVSHTYPVTDQLYSQWFWPTVVIKTSLRPDYFDSNYTTIRTDLDKDTVFNYYNRYYHQNYPSGTKLYVIIYGINTIIEFGYYDYKTRTNINPTLGEPSEVKSFIIP